MPVPQVATRDSKQYLQQLMIPESVMRVYHKGGSVLLQVTKARYFMSVKTENNDVPVSRQCFLTNVMFLILIFTSHCPGSLTVTSNFTFSSIMSYLFQMFYVVPRSSLSINANNLLTWGRGGLNAKHNPLRQMQ